MARSLTGVLGRRVVARLVEAGAEVTGVARSERKQAELRALGATPVEVSLFDPGASFYRRAARAPRAGGGAIGASPGCLG